MSKRAPGLDTSRLGKNWKRRLENAKATLIDAEGLLKDMGCQDFALHGVCEAIRESIAKAEENDR